MRTYMKVSGYWADENLAIRLVGCVYYFLVENVDRFIELQERIEREKGQFFETICVDYQELPYKPANVIKFLH